MVSTYKKAHEIAQSLMLVLLLLLGRLLMLMLLLGLLHPEPINEHPLDPILYVCDRNKLSCPNVYNRNVCFPYTRSMCPSS